MKKLKNLKPGDVIYECSDPYDSLPFGFRKQVIKEIVFDNPSGCTIFLEDDPYTEDNSIIIDREDTSFNETFYRDYFGDYIAIDPDKLREFIEAEIGNLNEHIKTLKEHYEQV